MNYTISQSKFPDSLLHERSVAHGDIKVDNIILEDDKHIWLVDFGHANIFEDISDDQSVKHLSKDISDITKLLYQLITGKPVYDYSEKYFLSEYATNLINNTSYLPEKVKMLTYDGIVPIAQRPDAKTFFQRLDEIINTTLHAPGGALLDKSTLAQWITDHWRSSQQDTLVEWLNGDMPAQIKRAWKDQKLAEQIQQRCIDFSDNKDHAIDAVLALVDPNVFGAQSQQLDCYLKIEPNNEQKRYIGVLQARKEAALSLEKEAALSLEVDEPASISRYTLLFSNPGERYVKARIASWPFWILIRSEDTIIELAPQADTHVEVPINLNGARFHSWHLPEEHIHIYFNDPLDGPRIARIRVQARAKQAATPKRRWSKWLLFMGLLGVIIATALYYIM